MNNLVLPTDSPRQVDAERPSLESLGLAKPLLMVVGRNMSGNQDARVGLVVSRFGIGSIARKRDEKIGFLGELVRITRE